MKRLFICTFILYSSTLCFSQKAALLLPSIDVKSLEGKTVNTTHFNNEGHPIVLAFWATWCKPCTKELNAIADVYGEWQEETKVKVIAISIDDARNTPKVAPYAQGKDWPFEIYIDTNSDLKRALNVNAIPHTFLLNGDKKIVWQHTSYLDGDEEVLYEEILKL